jgi:hypothetical protein
VDQTHGSFKQTYCKCADDTCRITSRYRTTFECSPTHVIHYYFTWKVDVSNGARWPHNLRVWNLFQVHTNTKATFSTGNERRVLYGVITLSIRILHPSSPLAHLALVLVDWQAVDWHVLISLKGKPWCLGVTVTYNWQTSAQVTSVGGQTQWYLVHRCSPAHAAHIYSRRERPSSPRHASVTHHS